MALSALLAGTGTAVWLIARPAPVQVVLESADRAMQLGLYEEAGRLAASVLEREPGLTRAVLIAGAAAVREGDRERAVRIYREVNDDGSADVPVVWMAEARLLGELGRGSEAEVCYRRVLGRDPEDRQALNDLGELLNLAGRRRDAEAVIFPLVRLGGFDLSHLVSLGDGEKVIEHAAPLENARRLAPEDPFWLLAEARALLFHGRPDDALKPLRQVVLRMPELAEAQVRLGQALLETGDEESFLTWHAALPPDVERHPHLWNVRSGWAERQGADRAAARCLMECLRRDPDNRMALLRLSSLIRKLGDVSTADWLAARSALVEKLVDTLDTKYFISTEGERMAEASRLNEALGRIWEAWAWASLAQRRGSTAAWVQTTLDRLKPQLSPSLPRRLAGDSPLWTLDLSGYPLPDWSGSDAIPSGESRQGRKSASEDRQPVIRFTNEAASAGVQFEYRNGNDDPIELRRIVETNGGGVGVLDFDGDLWPDLYFPQGADPDGTALEAGMSSRLYRNLDGARFEDVIGPAHAVPAGEGRESGQGVAAGDLDNDGFTDLYVATIGRNRLFHNRGDGTFEDWTDSLGSAPGRFTSSCLIADLDGDAFPDLYDVNYVGGAEIRTLVCDRNGRPVLCSPQSFPHAEDRLLLSGADGTFRDVSRDAGIVQPAGYGLGCLAADLRNSGWLDVFIANDEVLNFLFLNETSSPGAMVRFSEQALVRGVATDRDGFRQACMGVASGDVDGDGRLDLFVTNFYEESNVLYRQLSDGHFEDATRGAGLREPGFLMLGFGTQFLDGDNDGDLDLVVTNGHVTDLTHVGQPLQMPPQFFVNDGKGHFTEPDARDLGPFFEGRYLGRGLSRLDWNRDGLDDFAVCHLGSPAALVTCRTASPGRSVCVHLRGVASSRDAIGAVVTIETGGRVLMRQLTAGDGYQASNDRRLILGLGELAMAERMTILWPSGQAEMHRNLPADQELLFVEGRGRPVRVR